MNWFHLSHRGITADPWCSWCFQSECLLKLDPQWFSFSLRRSERLRLPCWWLWQTLIDRLTPNGSLKALEPLYRGFGIETSVGFVLPPVAPSSSSFCHRGNNRSDYQLLAHSVWNTDTNTELSSIQQWYFLIYCFDVSCSLWKYRPQRRLLSLKSNGTEWHSLKLPKNTTEKLKRKLLLWAVWCRNYFLSAEWNLLIASTCWRRRASACGWERRACDSVRCKHIEWCSLLYRLTRL